ncbi:hypothetical protein [Desulfoluna spongiiphila]|uniref:Uncharacterized protein n=1 Tax=Desulfoluna spongiiphila TaxID=419481 RepID=A0A1G5HDI9_9BACT|nr:hypothetical protein [Desulfoluna spongiiphila]SCY61767.1 hypothetical protein SAMN05216233_113115 [Desulfoluna spongiiphila]
MISEGYKKMSAILKKQTVNKRLLFDFLTLQASRARPPFHFSGNTMKGIWDSLDFNRNNSGNSFLRAE